ANFDFSGVARTRVLERVGKEIHQHLSQHRGITLHLRQTPFFQTMFRPENSGWSLCIVSSTSASSFTADRRSSSRPIREKFSKSSISRPICLAEPEMRLR